MRLFLFYICHSALSSVLALAYSGLLRNYVRPPTFERLQPHRSGHWLAVAEAQEIVAVMWSL